MREDSKLGSKIKAQITRFSGQIGEGLDKVRRRLVSEMLYGIQAAGDVKVGAGVRACSVSEIAPTLNEPIELIKTEERLCRNLAGTDLTDSPPAPDRTPPRPRVLPANSSSISSNRTPRKDWGNSSAPPLDPRPREEYIAKWRGGRERATGGPASCVCEG